MNPNEIEDEKSLQVIILNYRLNFKFVYLTKYAECKQQIVDYGEIIYGYWKGIYLVYLQMIPNNLQVWYEISLIIISRVFFIVIQSIDYHAVCFFTFPFIDL